MSSPSMPRIDRSCVATMKSPIRFLINKHVGDSVFKIALEHEKEFGTTLSNFNLIYLGQRPWEFCVNPQTRKIYVSRGAIELIWCASLAHLLFYERLIQGKRFDKPTQIDPQSDPIVRDAMELLRWSLNCQLNGDNNDDWPLHLPRPIEVASKESNENFADELCLVSCAFFLHHELAHLRLGHNERVNDEVSIKQEQDADIAAAKWILDGIETTDPKFVKRMLGIVQAFLIVTSIGLYSGHLGGDTHPYSYARLKSVLNRFQSPHSHDIKAFAFAVLDLHFQNSGRRLKKPKFDDFDQALEAICNQLAEEFEANKNVAHHD
ncbi:MAG: phage exclusion protein Lit family protein [Verrucomicrobiota bacterium]|jgi:hypothetical protein